MHAEREIGLVCVDSARHRVCSTLGLMKTTPFLFALFFSSIALRAWGDEPSPQPSVVATKPPPPPPPVVVVDACTILPQPGSECALSRGRATVIRGSRIGVELVLGTLLGAGLGALGAYAGLNADLAGGNEAGVGLGLGASFGVALGVAPGVWLGGRAMGGDGSFGWTLLGSAVGTGISATLLAFNSSPGMLVLGASIPLSLSILAFELSSHTRRVHTQSKPASAQVVPSIGPRYVGLSGTF